MKIRKEIIRFLVSGVLVNATDYSVYYVLFHFLPFSVAKGISFVCASLVGYLLNKYWIFPDGGPNAAEVRRYIFINLLALAVNIGTNQSVLNAWPHAVFPALVIASAVTGLLTFICFKWWVF